LRYTIEVRRKRAYDIDLRVASPDGDGRVTLVLDGKPLAGPVEVVKTGSWQVWKTVTVRRIEFPEGEHTLRVRMERRGMNLNWIEVRTPRRRRR
ncbi:MAG: carbohydrate-binding protein, partial [Planctomycetota bacterium]